MLIYLFLSERVYIVWSAGASITLPRRKSTVYQLCMLILLAYAGIMAFMFVGASYYQISILSADRIAGKVVDSARNNACHIGLHEYV